MSKLLITALTYLSLTMLVSTMIGCSPAQKEARHLKRAKNYDQRKQFDKAQIEYRNVVRLNPKNIEAVIGLGTVATRNGDLTVAYHAFTDALELTNLLTAPQELAVRGQLAKILFAVGAEYWKDARKQADIVLEREPTNPTCLLVFAAASQGAEITNSLQRLQAMPKQISSLPDHHLALAILYVKATNAAAAEAEYKNVLSVDPRATAALTGLGDLYWRQNRLQEANENFRAGAELMPLLSNERLKWADFKRQTGASAEAKSILSGMLAQNPDFVRANVMAAEIALDERRFDDAQAIVSKLLTKNSRNIDAMFLDAKIKLGRGNLAQGTKDLERLAEQYPLQPKLRYEYAVAELALNRSNSLAKADVALKEAIKQAIKNRTYYLEAEMLQATVDLKRGNLGAAITSLETLTNRAPTVLNVYFLLATAYLQQGNPEQAVAVYRILEKLAPGDGQVPLLMGLAYRQKPDHVKARQAFERALALTPENVAASRNLVELDIIEKKFDSALQRAEMLARRSPKSPDLQMLIAYVHRARGETAKAEAALQDILREFPHYSTALLELADMDVSANRFEAARQRLEQIAEKDTGNSRALLQLGMIYERNGDTGRAARAYEAALKADPKNAGARNNLAYIYAEAGNPNAYEHARQARELAPSDPSVADTMGWVLYKKGEYDSALVLFEEAAQKLGKSAEVIFHLGSAYYMTGREASALRALQRALELDSNFHGKEEAHRELQVLEIDASKMDQLQADALNSALAVHPADIPILSRLGAYYERSGLVARALESYERILQVSPKSVEILLTCARLGASQGQDSITIEKAMDRLEDARQIAPANARVAAIQSEIVERLTKYVSAAENGGRLPQASAILSKARKLWPEEPYFALALGRFKFDQKDFSEAIPPLRELARANKADADVFYRLGVAYYKTKDLQESRTAFQKALKLNLSGPKADEAMNLLKELRR